MVGILDTPPKEVRADLKALNAALDREIPQKRADNILIATWNIRRFGGLTREWAPTGTYAPKRDLRGLRAIVDILRRFDVVAVQEVTGDLRALRDTMRALGRGWSFLMTDVSRGSAVNNERLAFVFDSGRVQASGLAGEVVVPPAWIEGGDPSAVMRRQFVRPPYAVSFRAGNETFILVTTHIDYGDKSSDRLPELRALAKWMSDWADESNRFHHNLLVLGDFNIDRKDDALWQAFTGTGLSVPPDLERVKRSIFIEEGEKQKQDKFYDQIAWFKSRSQKRTLRMRYQRGGNFDFLPYVYTEQGLSKRAISHRISDHYPLWAAFERSPLSSR